MITPAQPGVPPRGPAGLTGKWTGFAEIAARLFRRDVGRAATARALLAGMRARAAQAAAAIESESRVASAIPASELGGQGNEWRSEAEAALSLGCRGPAGPACPGPAETRLARTDRCWPEAVVLLVAKKKREKMVRATRYLIKTRVLCTCNRENFGEPVCATAKCWQLNTN